LGLSEDAKSALVGRHELLERRGSTRELRDCLLEGSEQILESRGFDWTF
jgi:hypothetical protein